MKLSAEIREFLISRGLKEGSTDDEAFEFMRTLDIQKPKEPEPEPKSKPVAPKKQGQEAESGAVESIMAERKRIDDLTKIVEKSGMPSSELTRWIQNGTSVGAAREIGMEFMAERFRPVSVSGSRFEVVLDAKQKHLDAMEAAVCRRAMQNLEGHPEGFKWNEKACADVPTDIPIVEIARQMLIHAGLREAASMGRMEVATRALQHSTSDFPYLLANVAEKSIGVGYDEARTTYNAWCGTGSLPDFKVASRVAVGDSDDFEVVQELMPITETTMAEKRETRQLATYAKRFGVSRQAMVNDDLGEFSRTPQKLGAAAARTINTLVYQQLTTPPTMAEDSVALFGAHTSGSNTTVVAGVPTITGLNSAMLAMRKQLNVGYKARMNIQPRFLVAPAALEGTVRQLIVGTVYPTAPGGVVLDWMMNLVPVIEPLLDDTSATTWYVVASPNDIDTIRVEFLNGQERPSIIRLDGTAILGVEWVAYHDFSVKVFDHRGFSRITVA
jgi:hypothetical protein